MNSSRCINNKDLEKAWIRHQRRHWSRWDRFGLWGSSNGLRRVHLVQILKKLNDCCWASFIQCVLSLRKLLIVHITIVWTGNKMFEMNWNEMKCNENVIKKWKLKLYWNDMTCIWLNVFFEWNLFDMISNGTI